MTPIQEFQQKFPTHAELGRLLLRHAQTFQAEEHLQAAAREWVRRPTPPTPKEQNAVMSALKINPPLPGPPPWGELQWLRDSTDLGTLIMREILKDRPRIMAKQAE
jgi:hypothetical protein